MLLPLLAFVFGSLLIGAAAFVRSSSARRSTLSRAPWHPGPFTVTTPMPEGPTALRRGMLVVFRFPYEDSVYHVVRRVAALPGDTISMREGRAIVNGAEKVHAGNVPGVDPQIHPARVLVLDLGEVVARIAQGDNRHDPILPATLDEPAHPGFELPENRVLLRRGRAVPDALVAERQAERS